MVITATVSGMTGTSMGVSVPPPVVRDNSIESLNQTMQNLGWNGTPMFGGKVNNQPQEQKPEPKNEDGIGGMVLSSLTSGPMGELMHALHGASELSEELSGPKNQKDNMFGSTVGDPSALIRPDGRRQWELSAQSLRQQSDYETLKPRPPSPGASGPGF